MTHTLFGFQVRFSCLPFTYSCLASNFSFFFFYLLINRRDKSKTFTSRLMDQRARLVMMSRQGNPPEELENEKIAEFQLEKKKVRGLMNKKLEKKKKKRYNT